MTNATNGNGSHDVVHEAAPVQAFAPKSSHILVGGWPVERQQALGALADISYDTHRIAPVLLSEWWPEASKVRATIPMDHAEWWALPYGEAAVVDAIIRYLRPRALFEFGTFTGATTLVLADAAPEGAVIHTIDIPPIADEQSARAFEAISGVSPDLLGSRFEHRIDAHNEIRFHRSFTSDFDYSDLRGKIDFVLVDASHEYEDVLHDSRRALELLSPWGAIVWDDYDWTQPGVVRALTELSNEIELVQIASTRLVVHRRRGVEVPPDFDEEATDLFHMVQPYTLTGAERVVALRDAVDYVTRAQVPGAIVECGVYRGGSTMAAARSLVVRGSTERDVYMFDTFEAIPDATDRDVDLWGRSGAMWQAASRDDPLWEYFTVDEVENLVASTGYPRERLHIIKGMVEDTVPAHAPDEIAILRLDTDWYESTAHEMLHLFPRIVDGGVLIIDDYGYFKGAKDAVDEYLEANGISLLLHRIDVTGRTAVVHKR